MLDTFAERLEANLLGKRGKTIFTYAMPAHVEEGILLRDPLDGVAIDHELPGFFREAGFQLLVRATSHASGMELAQSATECLTISADTQFTGYLVRYSRPDHLPLVFPASEGDLLEISVNFSYCYVVTP
jgi:hypothetical protein